MIADPATLPLVRDALRDGDWWVRLRAGLASPASARRGATSCSPWKSARTSKP